MFYTGDRMLRCLTVFAALMVLSLAMYGQSAVESVGAVAAAKVPPELPGMELEIRKKISLSIQGYVLALAATGNHEAEKAFIVSEHTGDQAEAQAIRFIARFESEWSAWLKPKIIPAESANTKAAQQSATTANGHDGFHWAAALKQSLLFLGAQHGYAMTQAKTRRELRGPFFKDYFRSVRNLGGWDDGGRFFTNYISHPMEGSIAGFIQIQNDPKGIKQEFGKSRGYWTSRLKAMAWNAVYSTQFEIGPISQSSIGNVGLHTSLDGKKRKMAYGDLVVTPTLGTAWLIGEDFLDRFVVQRLELKTNRPLARNAARVLLNPMRGAANMLRFKMPWYRDR